MNNTTRTVGLIVLLFLVAGGVYVALSSLAPREQAVAPTDNQSANPNANGQPSNPTTTPGNDSGSSNETTNGAKTYTLADVAAHNNPSDCWLVIHDKVYNVSNFGSNHAGGAAVYEGCGKDATQLFEERPGDGEPHSSKARSFLPNFYIGELQK